MAYCLYDFSESLKQVAIDAADIALVISAWGANGDCAEWSGGFVLALKDGRTAVLTGWCDTTGWGCQDGANLAFVEAVPTFETVNAGRDKYEGLIAATDWDDEPADLNKWLADGAKDTDAF